MTQKRISLSSPDIIEPEIQEVLRVFRSGRLSLGPEIQTFEKEFAAFIGVPHAVAVSSGTAGLHCVVRTLGIGEGDEVITTPFSFIASANCILFEKATPVFVDIDPATGCMDVEAIEAKITPKTKAILAVHVLGVSCDMHALTELARKHKLFLIEDACEAIGGTFGERQLGSFGNAGVFAFYPNKQMTTGEGGMIVTSDANLAAVCRSLRNQGRSAEDGNVFERLGYNYRMSEFQAALGRTQLARLPEILERRRQVALAYQEELRDCEDVQLPPGLDNPATSWFIYLIRLSERFTSADRHEVRRRLLEEGVETGAYFSPIHLQKFYVEQFSFAPGDFPITEFIAARTIALPFYTNLKREDIRYACDSLKKQIALALT